MCGCVRAQTISFFVFFSDDKVRIGHKSMSTLIYSMKSCLLFTKLAVLWQVNLVNSNIGLKLAMAEKNIWFFFLVSKHRCSQCLSFGFSRDTKKNLLIFIFPVHTDTGSKDNRIAKKNNHRISLYSTQTKRIHLDLVNATPNDLVCIACRRIETSVL